MNHSNVKVVFIDVGGVLLSNGWGHESREKAAKKFGLNYGEMDSLHNFIYNVFEIGKITLDDYLDTVVFNKPRDFSREAFKEFIYGESHELPELLPWLKKWKKTCHMRVFSINNESRELNDYRIKTFGLHDVFDGFVSSCHVGMRKPDPGIFNVALDITQVRPEESIYFDDRIMLVKAAGKLGINSYHHKEFQETKVILEGLTNG